MKPTRNLIYDRPTVKPPNQNVVISANALIKAYSPLEESLIHDIERLDDFVNQPDSVLYKFGKTVLKFQQNDRPGVELFNKEIIVGLELNRLNSDNFVRTIGYFIDDRCRIPKLVDADSCTYLYLREIPGPTLTKFLITASLPQFKAIMLKLLKGYAVAVTELDFCHYDLHSNNVIITTVGDELVPVIIDFGASHLRIFNKAIGEYVHVGEDWPEVGRYHDRSLWVYDIFKIFAFCWYRSSYSFKEEDEQTEQQRRDNYNSLSQIAKFCRRVLSYFHRDVWGTSFLEYFKRTNNQHWSVSVTEEGEKASLQEFIRYYETLASQ